MRISRFSCVGICPLIGKSFSAHLLKHDIQLSPFYGIIAAEKWDAGGGKATCATCPPQVWYNSFTIEPEGTLLFRWGFPDEEGLLGWVLTFGDGAELLEPVELRENLAHMLRRALSHYE